VEGTEAAEAGIGDAEVGLGEGELEGDDEAHEHPYNPPNEGCRKELAHDGVVVDEPLEPAGPHGVERAHPDIGR